MDGEGRGLSFESWRTKGQSVRNLRGGAGSGSECGSPGPQSTYLIYSEQLGAERFPDLLFLPLFVGYNRVDILGVKVEEKNSECTRKL